MQTIEGNFLSVSIGLISVEYWLNFTNVQNENQYLTDI